jgi:hypothetical protein
MIALCQSKLFKLLVGFWAGSHKQRVLPPNSLDEKEKFVTSFAATQASFAG